MTKNSIEVLGNLKDNIKLLIDLLNLVHHLDFRVLVLD